ncbi:MAG: type II toxin-antitoxin system RelE/ParE family toxin [Terriglobia bacterium]
MTRIRWTTDAANQLEGIVKRIQESNPDAARKTAQAILGRITDLEDFPNLGRPGEEVRGTRELVCPPYVIVYRLKDDVAEVLYIGCSPLSF